MEQFKKDKSEIGAETLPLTEKIRTAEENLINEIKRAEANIISLSDKEGLGSDIDLKGREALKYELQEQVEAIRKSEFRKFFSEAVLGALGIIASHKSMGFIDQETLRNIVQVAGSALLGLSAMRSVQFYFLKSHLRREYNEVDNPRGDIIEEIESNLKKQDE